jgi:hypothetical protein
MSWCSFAFRTLFPSTTTQQQKQTAYQISSAERICNGSGVWEGTEPTCDGIPITALHAYMP